MELPPEAEQRVAQDGVAWLTTITDTGAPAPNPVWFVSDGGKLVVFAEPASRKVHNIQQRPRVCLHFNSDPGGSDIVIINGFAEVILDQVPTDHDAYIQKYMSHISDILEMGMETFDATYAALIRIDPSRVRLTPGY